jgi:hypothetical protein
VQVFDGKTGNLVESFFATTPSFTGGIRVGAADVTGAGHADIITGAGPGGLPQVTVFDGLTTNRVTSFYAFPGGFAGGVYVAGGTVTAGSLADIIVGAGPGGLPEVGVFDGTGVLLKAFFAFSPPPDSGSSDVVNIGGPLSFGGVRVAAHDLTGSGVDDILVGPGPGPAQPFQAYDPASLSVIDQFFAFGPFTGGIFVG